MDWSNLAPAIVGIAGIPLGVLLGEFVRRRQRAEQFASALFARRLEAYEILMRLLQEGGRLAEQVMSDPNLSADQRHELISTAIMPIAEHSDANVLYIDEELGAHCTALFMGVEDIPDLPEDVRDERIAEYRHQLRETRRMIFEDSGIEKVKAIFRAINRPRISSPVIERIRELRREQKD
jgi:hypothetical protein